MRAAWSGSKVLRSNSVYGSASVEGSASTDRAASVRRISGVTVITVGSLDKLPPTLRKVRG